MDQLDFKPLFWATGSKDELHSLPKLMVHNFGYALSAVQFGGNPKASVKALQSFSLPLLELRDSDSAGTYRVVYCVALKRAVYVLHCFQKKSPVGAKISRPTAALIGSRLKEVRLHHEKVVKLEKSANPS